MTLLVGGLEEHLVKRQESSLVAPLHDFAVDDEAARLTVGDKDFPLDDVASGALTRYLRIPHTYYAKLDPDFKAATLRYHFDRNKEAQTVVEALGTEILAIHQPSQAMIPVSRVAKVVTKTLQPDDIVRRIISDESRLHIDATTPRYSVDVEPEVGDITQAGFRVVTHPYRSKPPIVSTYLERLVCSNGMCTPESVDKIAIKGRTVDEVIAEMELAAELVLGQLDTKLADYAATRTMVVPGSPQAFVAQLAKEMNVSRQVLDAVLSIVNQIPAPVTVWSVNQAFTTVANQVERYATMTKLQTLGGYLSFQAEQAIARCGTCQQHV